MYHVSVVYSTYKLKKGELNNFISQIGKMPDIKTLNSSIYYLALASKHLPQHVNIKWLLQKLKIREVE